MAWMMLALYTLLLGLSVATSSLQSLFTKPPHIVFLLGDEVGYNNVGWHSNITLTPSMNALATSGIILERHYVQRWCAPTRAALMTGRYPYNVGMNDYGKGIAEERSGVPSTFAMLPKILKQAPTPYKTHHLGKWHLGFFSKKHTPVGHGFDASFGFLLGQSTHDTRGSQITHTCSDSVTDLYNSTHIANTSDYYWDREYNTDMYADEACAIIQTHDQTIPMFLYMAFQNCHGPYQVPDHFMQLYPNLPHNQSQQCFNGMVSAMDVSIGRITHALKDSGMYDNTVIVYSSDNGGPAYMSNNIPLRGAKFGVFEGSFRVPAFVHSPLLPPHVVGTTSTTLMHVTDWYRIFASMAGVPEAIVNASGPVPPDGVNTWKAMVSGNLLPSPRTMIVHEYDDTNKIFAFRSGDYKLMFGKIGTSEWIPDVSYDTPCSFLLPPINHSIKTSLKSFFHKLSNHRPDDVDSGGGDGDDSGGGGGRDGGGVNHVNDIDMHHGAGSVRDVNSAGDMHSVGDVNSGGQRKPSPPPGPGSGLVCTNSTPCLFDVVADPTEHTNIAASNPDVVARLRKQLATYVENRYTGGLDQAKMSETSYCNLIKTIKWVQPYDDGGFPPPPPSPPT